jgi:glutamate N-acetyltransferase/amino-acid N-acetyltransferase
MQYLAREIARDGEGATKLLTCTVRGAGCEDTAETLAKAVIASSLVKAAMFGSDANWGRILCAMGYSGAPFNPGQTDISLYQRKDLFPYQTYVYRILMNTGPQNFKGRRVTIDTCIATGLRSHCVRCDLSYDYVKINGDTTRRVAALTFLF